MKKIFQFLTAGVVLAITPFSVAATPDWAQITDDVVIIGEFHDNPTHHETQIAAITAIAPKAVVFEMLTPDEAGALADVPRQKRPMKRAMQDFHWGNITDYAGVLAASDVIIGAALPRDAVRKAFSDGAAKVFGEDAATYGLTDPLPDAQLETRKQMQFDAHCAAMPLEMMGGMVEAQRLRDAAFARTVLEALDTHGAPVVLITGNGHARMDWGVPSYLALARPDLTVTSIAQGEDGRAPLGTFGMQIINALAPERDDPCKAFR